MTEFNVTVVTVRSGTHIVRVEADNAAAARSLVQSDCNENECHCPPEWCTDDVQSDAVDVREIVLERAAAKRVGTGGHTRMRWSLGKPPHLTRLV